MQLRVAPPGGTLTSFDMCVIDFEGLESCARTSHRTLKKRLRRATHGRCIPVIFESVSSKRPESGGWVEHGGESNAVSMSKLRCNGTLPIIKFTNPERTCQRTLKRMPPQTCRLIAVVSRSFGRSTSNSESNEVSMNHCDQRVSVFHVCTLKDNWGPASLRWAMQRHVARRRHLQCPLRCALRVSKFGKLRKHMSKDVKKRCLRRATHGRCIPVVFESVGSKGRSLEWKTSRLLTPDLMILRACFFANFARF